MNVKRVLLMALGAFVLCALVVGGCLYSGYNRAVMLDEQVNSQWAQVENQLQRRFDLVPNLVETVKGITEHEQEVYLGLAEARQAYFQAGSVQEKAQAAGTFESALSRLLMLREAYPQLRANESFLKLQDQLEGTENRLAVERQRYNETVRQLNTYRRTLLGRVYCALAGVEPATYFEIPQAVAEVPRVRFTQPDE